MVGGRLHLYPLDACLASTSADTEVSPALSSVPLGRGAKSIIWFVSLLSGEFCVCELWPQHLINCWLGA